MMNKKISTAWGIGAVVIAAIIFAGGVFVFNKTSQPETTTQNIPKNNVPAPTGGGQKEQACLSSGGKISNSSCCQSSGDFPNSCAIGACGCAPASSHQVKTCDCGEGKCFDGNSCVGNTPGTSRQTSSQKSDPMENVKSFYNWYIQAAFDLTSKYTSHEISDSEVIVLEKKLDEQVKNRPELASQAYAKIKAHGSHFDPFICTQGDPDTANFKQQPIIKGKTATVVIETGFKNSDDPKDTTYTHADFLTVKLVLENGTWKIDDVACEI
jgi:hypothetical protein